MAFARPIFQHKRDGMSIDPTRTGEQPGEASEDGYTWGALYLPNGTELRAKYYGTIQLAIVLNGHLSFSGKSYSTPLQLAKAMRCRATHNAWRVLEIKLPGATEFLPAHMIPT
jgi:hypothetical protein